MTIIIPAVIVVVPINKAKTTIAEKKKRNNSKMRVEEEVSFLKSCKDNLFKLNIFQLFIHYTIIKQCKETTGVPFMPLVSLSEFKNLTTPNPHDH